MSRNIIYLVLIAFNVVWTGVADDGLHEQQTLTAVVTLAVGERAKLFAEMLLLSFVRHGNGEWCREHADERKCVHLFVVTEDVHFFDTLSVMHAESIGAQTSLLHIISVAELNLTEKTSPERPGSSSKTGSGAHRARHKASAKVDHRSGANLTNNAHMRVKLLKTRLFDYVPRSFTQIIYVDSDIVFGTPVARAVTQCADAFARTPPSVLALFPDIGLSEAPYHTGVICMHRTHSSQILDTWMERINSGEFRRDQWALKNTVDHLKLRRRMHLLDPYAERLFTFPNATVFADTQPYTFLHATLYRLSQPARPEWAFALEDAVSYYTRVLHLPFYYDFVSKALYMD